MEKLNIFFLIIIFIYLLYSFLKSRKKEKIEEKQLKLNKCKQNKNLYYYVSAVIASVMEGKKYRIKKVFIKGREDKKNSFWKISGRHENMLNIKK